MLVDDSGLARGGVRQILESAGYEVVEAEDGLSALEHYSLEKPHVVLLDLVMKGMNGLDVLKKLQQMDSAARAVVVSADIQDSSRALAEAGRACGFVTKPVERAGILKAVAGALDMTR